MRRLVLALLLTLAAATAGADGFTRGADVVVLTGLPGDVESETAFATEAERLVEALGREEARPRRLYVLTDSGEAAAWPPGLDAEARPGNRRGVLALAEELRGSDAPLVVFAWGHGGLQGRDPVFHVRGPRLLPADFVALAEATSGASRWVLAFRQSGAFARALRGAGREVLASEDEVAFQSDPVMMRLVAELLRDDPGLSFAGLGEHLGHRVTSWYEEQRLARQEDPTLWIADAPPRRLADEAAQSETSPPKPALAEAKLTETQPKDAEGEALGTAWQDFERLDPDAYPGADAVVLRRTLAYTLGDKPALQTESDELIQILTEEGTAHGDFDVSYSPPGEKVTFLDCEVLHPDGTLVRLPPAAIQDAATSALPGYQGPARKLFSLPGVRPGAVLRVHYRREWERFPLPYVPIEIPLQGPLPVVRADVSVRIGVDRPLHYAFRDHPGIEPEVAETAYSRTTSWRFHDLPARVDEVLSPPSPGATLLVSSFPSWREFSEWYRRLVRLADELTPELAAKAAELTAGAASDREKVEALYDFVTSMRYVAIPLGVNSHRPHAAKNVFENRYGDCKDKANLFNTLLGAVGIEADLVLVPRFSQADERTPGLGFNHAISRVRLGDEVIWADTTDDTARFGLLPPGDPGRKVLVIHEDVDDLVELPRPRAADHRLEIVTTIDLPDDGAVDSKVDAVTSGFPDYTLRAAARRVGSRSRTRPLLAGVLRSVQGSFALSEQSSTPAAALGEAFTYHAAGSWSGIFSGGVLRLPFQLPAEWTAALHERESPLYLNHGYPLTLAQEIVVELGGRRVERLPAPAEGGGVPLRWKVSFEDGGSRLRARLEVVLASGELDASETPSFQSELRRLFDALGPRSDVWTTAKE